jgi:hypothetical protein
MDRQKNKNKNPIPLTPKDTLKTCLVCRCILTPLVELIKSLQFNLGKDMTKIS